MRRICLWLVCAGALGATARAASPLYVSPDVPTDETASGTTVLPWTVARYDGAVPAYTGAFTLPGNPTIDALHRRDGKDNWLFSFESANDLAGGLPAPADPRDVVAFDGSTGTYSIIFCGGAVGVPAYANVDALYEIYDGGPLVLSFDVPTTIGPDTFDPADLVRFDRVGLTCADWVVGAGNPLFDASAAGTGVPTWANVVGADATGGRFVLAFDVPVDLGPPGIVTFTPGQLVSWDGVSYALFEPLAGWPISSISDGFSLLPNPGIVPPTIHVDKALAGDITISWGGSCSSGADDYGIYEGTIGLWYSHTALDCSDAGGDRKETITPAAASSYFLVVAHHAYEEGSYGTDSSSVERPVGAAVCAAAQSIAPCPP